MCIGLVGWPSADGVLPHQEMPNSSISLMSQFQIRKMMTEVPAME